MVNNEDTYMVAVDLSAAFSNVNPKMLINFWKTILTFGTKDQTE